MILDCFRWGPAARRSGLAAPVAASLAALTVGCTVLTPLPRSFVPLRPDTLEHNGWDRDCDLLHLALDLRIDLETRSVAGRAENRVRALRGGTEEVRLHAVGLSVSSVVDEEQRELAFEVREPWLVVHLARPLERGEETSLIVSYSCKPERGLYFVDHSRYSDGFAPQVWSHGQKEDHRHWIPTWDYPSDRATFEGRFRVAGGLEVVSNGTLEGIEEHDDGERSFHWHLEQEIPTYLVGLAAGLWEKYEDEWRGIPVEYYVGPGAGEERARRAFGETPQMLEFFSELLQAPYPYPKYAQVAVAEFPRGGMENATVTIETDSLIGDAGEIGDLDGLPRLLVAHELAHHWFGNLITCLGWSHLWLNEAWAAYLELLFEEHKTDHGNFELWLERYREWYLTRSEARVPMALDWFTQEAGARDNHVYDKGPWILHMIRHELGDEVFWTGVRAYVARHAGGLVTSQDFARALFDATGRNIEGLLEQWVEAGGFPVYDVRFRELRPRGEGPRLSMRVRQLQKLDRTVPLFDMPIDVELFYTDGRRARHRLRVRERDGEYELPLEGELVDVVFDADCAVLCQLRLSKPTAMWVHQAGLDSRPALQWRALDELHKRAGRDEAARAAILRTLRTSPQPLLRERAAEYADFQDSRARFALVEAVTGDQAVRVRRQAVHTLLQASSRQQFDPDGELYERFLEYLPQETSPAVRDKVLKLLRLEE